MLLYNPQQQKNKNSLFLFYISNDHITPAKGTTELEDIK